MKLLSIGTNAKTIKSDKYGKYLTAILYLAPANIAGRNVCPYASAGCKQACLYSAGRGAFSNVQNWRIEKTKLFHNERNVFFKILCKEIEAFAKKCKKLGVKPCVRLNGTSDIAWESYKIGNSNKNIFEFFNDIEFYDYTKWPSHLRKNLPENYSVTFSRSEITSEQEIHDNIKIGRNVAVVFSTENLPETYLGYKVINGDKDDLRFLDPEGVIVGLKAKGQARKDTSGFVVEAPLIQLGKVA